MVIWEKFRDSCNKMNGNLKEDAIGTASCVFSNGEITIFETGDGTEVFVNKDYNNLDLLSKNLDIRDGLSGRKEFFGIEGILEVDVGLNEIKSAHIKDKNGDIQGFLGRKNIGRIELKR